MRANILRVYVYLFVVAQLFCSKQLFFWQYYHKLWLHATSSGKTLISKHNYFRLLAVKQHRYAHIHSCLSRVKLFALSTTHFAIAVVCSLCQRSALDFYCLCTWCG